MDSNQNHSSSTKNRINRIDSCSSLSSFANDTPQKKKKTDRMIFSIDKAEFEWSQKKTKKKPTKQQKIHKPSPEEKFEDYLSDNLSNDTSPLHEFIGKTVKRSKQFHLRRRKVCQEPFKHVTLQNWKDNFYTNLLDWNYQNFVFAATDNEVAMYSLDSFETKEFKIFNWPKIKMSKINAIKCSPTYSHAAVAYNNGNLQVFDYCKFKPLIFKSVHAGRITALDWSQRLVLTGSKDCRIRILDQRTLHDAIQFNQFHNQQVLGIKRCGDLVASGGNDNFVAIYDIRKPSKIFDTYEHVAAVKSLAWIQKQKILLSGGGTTDKMIKFWNYHDMKVNKEVETGSQVCNLVVSKTTRQFVSCQGFSQNQIVIWDFDGNKLQILHGKHQARVLYCAISPTGQYLATGAGDNNLYIWKMFPVERKNRLMEISDLR